MQLKDLLRNSKQFSEVLISNVPQKVVTGITHDSREIVPGNVFVAFAGDNFDGHDHIEDAIKNGASAIVGEYDLKIESTPYLKVKNSRESLAYLSAAFYDFPSRKLTVIGVTGTDGKTTTVNLIYNILVSCGIQAGMISTVNAVIGNEQIDTGFHVTTPESPKIQALLKEMVDYGLTHVVIEATSHGLAQYRVTACNFDIGVITNITHEHLDFHGDYDNYLTTKASLLTELTSTPSKGGMKYQIAVLNRDDISYDPLMKILRRSSSSKTQIVEYGVKNDAEFRGSKIKNTEDGLQLEINYQGLSYKIQTTLMGEYNAQNILASITSVVAGLGLDINCAVKGIQTLEGVPGRMEKINLGQDFMTIVDFAHTPNALKVALETSKNRTKHRVISVFGAAGLRDREKRRLMAATSIASADVTILTAEDPRTESLDAILAEMADEAEKQGGVENETFFRIPDRGEAIKKAISIAQKDDLVIICGKGHEQSMCFGQTEYLWDDRTALRSALSDHLRIEGPEMPYLPTQG